MISLASKIAQNVVRQSLRVREDDVVLIYAAGHMTSLADEIAIECRKAGAETSTMYWSEPLWYWSLEQLPTEWLRGPSKIDLALLDVATAIINMEAVADPKPMARISPERWAANSEGADPYYRKLVDRKVRTARLALPTVTAQRARAYGFSYPAWKRGTERALKADYPKIAATGRKLRGLLEGSNQEVRIKSKNGTDLSFRLAGRKSWVDDGILDDEDVAAGTFQTELPAGYIAIAPAEDSANGKVVFDLPVPQRGKLIRGLSWTFQNGQITNFAASKNSDMVIPIWEKSAGDKSKFASFQIGLNTEAPTGFLNDYIHSGAITLGIGDNKALRGQNESTYGFQATLKASTVTVNGETIVSAGRLTL
jgi:aminopeptidase